MFCSKKKVFRKHYQLFLYSLGTEKNWKVVPRGAPVPLILGDSPRSPGIGPTLPYVTLRMQSQRPSQSSTSLSNHLTVKFFVETVLNDMIHFSNCWNLNSSIHTTYLSTRPARVCWPRRCPPSLRPPRWSRTPLAVLRPSRYDYKGPLRHTVSSGSAPAPPWTCTRRCPHSWRRMGPATVPNSDCSPSTTSTT